MRAKMLAHLSNHLFWWCCNAGTYLVILVIVVVIPRVKVMLLFDYCGR